MLLRFPVWAKVEVPANSIKDDSRKMTQCVHMILVSLASLKQSLICPSPRNHHLVSIATPGSFV
jgi:hypothetical protein